MFNEKDIKDKIKPYESKIFTDFHDNAMSKKECSQCIRLSVLLLIDCIFEMGRSYYSQALLEKSNYLALYFDDIKGCFKESHEKDSNEEYINA